MSETFGQLHHPAGPCEVYVSGDADYDEVAQTLTVALDARLRTLDLLHKESLHRADWMPKPRNQTEHVGLDEAREAAREIFHSWVHQVRESLPRADSEPAPAAT